MNSANKRLYINLLISYFMENFYLNKKVYCKNCYFNIKHMRVLICDGNSMASYKLKEKYRIYLKFFNKIIINSSKKTISFMGDEEIFIKNFL